jgi:hypothetical protein
MRNPGRGSDGSRQAGLVRFRLTNVSTGPSTVLGIVSPAGFERFWEEISQLPPSDMDAILVIAKKYQLEIHAP